MTGDSARGRKPGLRRRRLLQAGLAASAAGAAGTAAAVRAAAATERAPATIAELRALPPGELAAGTIVQLAGYHAAGDGGGGTFRFDGASTAPDDGGLAIKPAGREGAGRWLRLVSGLSLSPKWFGARGGGRAAAAAPVQAALDAARGRYLVDIDDTYLIEASLILRHDGQVIAGQGTFTGAIAAYPRIAGNAPAEMKDRYGEGSYAVASLAADGATIAATTARPHNFRSGDRVAVFFALPDSYCGIQPVTVTGERSFTYRVAEAPAGPATLYGALCSRIDHPVVSAPHDPVAATGGACFRPQGDVTKVEIKGITIANFRYAALLSGPDVAEPSRVAAVNMLVFDHVTFDNVNICGFGYPFIQGGSFLDCTYREVNCIACGNAVCLPVGHPYAGSDTQFVVLLSLDNRSGMEQRLRLNANLDLWFYESVLRPETASVNPQRTPVWFLPFRRGKDKMPPSQAAVSGHAVYCPSRSASRQYQATIRNLNTIDSYRSLVVFGQPSYLLMDCLGTETYVAPMPGEPLVHLVLAYGPEGNIPFGSEGVLRRIQNFLFGNRASKSVEIDRIRYDESGFIARAGDPFWLGGTQPSGLIAIDCETPNDCAMQLGNGTLRAAAFALSPQIVASSPARRGVSVVEDAVQPPPMGLSELAVHRSSGSFLLGSPARGSTGNRLQLCGSVERPTRGVMEILALRLDSGESDYCRLRFSLPPRLDGSPAGLGRLVAELIPGAAAAEIEPGSVSNQALLPGLAISIGGNRLLVKHYDRSAHRLTFHGAARLHAPAGSGISARGELRILDPFAGTDIFEPPYLNGAAIELRTPLYADGSPAAIPIAVTFWSTDTLYFDGGN